MLVGEAALADRRPAEPDLSANGAGTGRELFGALRAAVLGAEAGASSFAGPGPQAG